MQFYFAPETILGQPEVGKSDVFSIGVIAYKLRSGITENPWNIANESAAQTTPGIVADLMTTAVVQNNEHMSAPYFDLVHQMVNTDVNARIDVEAALQHSLFDDIRDRFSTTEDAWRIGDEKGPHHELRESVDSGRFNLKYNIYNGDIYEKDMKKPVKFSI